MKSLKKGIALVISMLIMVACLTACGGGGGNTPEPAGGSAGSPEPATANKAEVATQTYTIEDADDGAVMTLEVPELEGLEVSEINDRSGYRMKYPDGGWQLELWIDSYNSQALVDKIKGGESVTYGSNTGSLEFSSWAAQGEVDFGPIPDSAVSIIAKYDLRPADTYQPDDEAELRGYLADENVGLIFEKMKVELTK